MRNEYSAKIFRLYIFFGCDRSFFEWCVSPIEMVVNNYDNVMYNYIIYIYNNAIYLIITLTEDTTGWR